MPPGGRSHDEFVHPCRLRGAQHARKVRHQRDPGVALFLMPPGGMKSPSDGLSLRAPRCRWVLQPRGCTGAPPLASSHSQVQPVPIPASRLPLVTSAAGSASDPGRSRPSHGSSTRWPSPGPAPLLPRSRTSVGSPKTHRIPQEAECCRLTADTRSRHRFVLGCISRGVLCILADPSGASGCAISPHPEVRKLALLPGARSPPLWASVDLRAASCRELPDPGPALAG